MLENSCATITRVNSSHHFIQNNACATYPQIMKSKLRQYSANQVKSRVEALGFSNPSKVHTMPVYTSTLSGLLREVENNKQSHVRTVRR